MPEKAGKSSSFIELNPSGRAEFKKGKWLVCKWFLLHIKIHLTSPKAQKVSSLNTFAGSGPMEDETWKEAVDKRTCWNCCDITTVWNFLVYPEGKVSFVLVFFSSQCHL